jgi:hypothetical protein
MAILTMFEVYGDDPEDMVERTESAMGPDAVALAGEHGAISNTIVKTDKGIMIVNLWESEEGMESFASLMRPRIDEAGAGGEQVGWRMYEVLRHRTPAD